MEPQQVRWVIRRLSHWIPFGSASSRRTGRNRTPFGGRPIAGPVIERLESRLALTAVPRLVENINFGNADSSPLPDTFTTIGSTTFFAAMHADAGVELWKTNGTAEGTVLVKDIWPGPASSILGTSWLGVPNAGRVYFTAQVVQGGQTFTDLWTSDGTEAGTTNVTKSPAFSATPLGMGVVGSRVFFQQGNMLSTIDTATQQITPVRQFNTIGTEAVAFRSRLYFAADNGQGWELYSSDGSFNGTSLVKDINPRVGGSSFPADFTVVGSRLFLTADNGDSGRELWVTDGTLNGTQPVDDINPLGASSNPDSLAALGGKLYFSAHNSQKRDMYVYDPATPAVKPVRIEINRGTIVGSDPDEFTLFNGAVYFVGTSAANGREVFRLSGTTPVLIDVAAGPADSFPTGLKVVGQSLVFAATSVAGDTELYRIDTAGRSSLLKNIWNGGSSFPEILAAAGSRVYFSADNGVRGRELWKTDGTAAGTVIVRNLNDGPGPGPVSDGRLSSYAAESVTFDGRLFFTADAFKRFAPNGVQLADRNLYSIGSGGSHALGRDTANKWTLNPPVNGLPPNAATVIVSAPTVVGRTLYFSVSYNDQDGRLITGGSLYKLVAGATAAVEVKRFAGAAPEQLRAFKGRLFFSADEFGFGRQLWVSGGTGDSTIRFGDPLNPPSDPYELTVFGDFMFFTATEQGTGNYEVWRTDGRDGGSTGRFADLNSDQGSFPSQFTPYQGKLYFGATGKDANGDYGYELYWTDGVRTPALTRNIDDRPGASSFPSNFTGFKGHLYFSASTPDHGDELWRTNGTVTERMTDLAVGPANAFPSEPTVVGDRLFISASDGTWGELWSSTDGRNFTRATSINPNGFAAPSSLASAGGRLYFSANDGVRGDELWEFNPATNRARLVADINLGGAGSWPTLVNGANRAPTIFDGKLYFTADDGIAGYEPMALPLVTTPGTVRSMTATPGQGQVRLTWNAPSSNGGSTITDYVVQFSSDAGKTWQMFNDGVSTAGAVTVTGLTNGTRYLFRVAAVNAIGRGSFVTSAAVTPRTVPRQPVLVSATRGNREVRLTWNAPNSNGGATITDYVIEYSSNNGKTWRVFNDGVSTSRAVTVTGLTNGTKYVFRVAARNVAGLGAFSAKSASVTPKQR